MNLDGIMERAAHSNAPNTGDYTGQDGLLYWVCGGTGNDWSEGGMTDGRGKKNRRTAEID